MQWVPHISLWSFCCLVLISLCLTYNLIAQSEDESILNQKYSSSEENLLQTYLTRSGSLQHRIHELYKLAKSDKDQGDVLKALQKVQVAMILDDELREPSIESFDLYFFAAQLMAYSDLRYSLEFFRKACDLIPLLKEPNKSDVFSLLTNRAGVHGMVHEPDSALYYFHQAIKAARDDSPSAQVSSYNNLGVFFLNAGKLDSAKYYFTRARQMLSEQKEDIMLLCAIKDNLAQLAIHDHDYLSALTTFQYNDSIYLSRQKPIKYIANKIRLMQAMQQLHSAGITALIPALEDYIQAHLKEIHAHEVLDFYQFADQYYYDKRKYELAKTFQHKYAHWVDSLDHIASDQMHSMAQSFLAVQKVSFQNEIKANNLVAKQTMILLLLYFQLRRKQLYAQRQFAESKIREKEMEARLVAQELDLKKKDLTNLVLHNTQVYDANQKMIDRLHDMTSAKGELEQNTRTLLLELQRQNQVSERSNLLVKNIESLNAEFYEKLREKYHDLTKAEAELCGYIRINLSSKDIAILKNVEAASVKMGKNRLRKKLGVGPDEDIYVLIQKV